MPVMRKGSTSTRTGETGRVEVAIGKRTQKVVVPGDAQVQNRLDPNDVVRRLPAMLRLLIKRLTNK